MIIVTLYIVLPAKRARAAAQQTAGEGEQVSLQGTGGTDLINFLKRVRDRTANTRIDPVPQNVES